MREDFAELFTAAGGAYQQRIFSRVIVGDGNPVIAARQAFGVFIKAEISRLGFRRMRRINDFIIFYRRAHPVITHLARFGDVVALRIVKSLCHRGPIVRTSGIFFINEIDILARLDISEAQRFLVAA